MSANCFVVSYVRRVSVLEGSEKGRLFSGHLFVRERNCTSIGSEARVESALLTDHIREGLVSVQNCAVILSVLLSFQVLLPFIRVFSVFVSLEGARVFGSRKSTLSSSCSASSSTCKSFSSNACFAIISMGLLTRVLVKISNCVASKLSKSILLALDCGPAGTEGFVVGSGASNCTLGADSGVIAATHVVLVGLNVRVSDGVRCEFSESILSFTSRVNHHVFGLAHLCSFLSWLDTQ